MTTIEEKELIKLIDNYLSGKCTRDEKIFLEEWYELNADESSSFYNMNNKAIHTSTKRSLKIIRKKLNLNPVKKTLWSKYPRWAVAASLFLLVTVGLIFYQQKVHTIEKYTILTTQTGQLKQFTLPDGSIVWLNAKSNLKYSNRFNQEERNVYLDGEGYFDVAHNPAKPFKVFTGKITTRVLGTAFAVSAYSKLLKNTVTVLRGKVQVSDSLHVIGRLLPNKQISYETFSGRSITEDVNAQDLLTWKDGKLVFNDMPMQDITVHLEKWYGYNFLFKNEQLKKIHFTASFRNSITIADLLKIITSVGHVTYQLDEKNKTVTFL